MSIQFKGLAVASLIGLLVCCACTSPQYVVYIDTDAPVLGQLSMHPELSADAAIDVVRVDVLDERGQSYEVCEFVASEPGDWPLSFGIVPPPAGRESPPRRLRIRGFKRLFATPDQLSGVSRICGKELPSPDRVSVSNPRPEVTIDRVIELASPTPGVERVRVHLSLGCIGVPASFLSRTNCVDEAHLSMPFTSGVYPTEDSGAGSAAIGTSPLAREAPCTAPAPALAGAKAVCIPGGFSIQGDTELSGIYEPLLEPAPLRPVWVSPFYMDTTEFTVGRVRALLKRGARIELPVGTNSSGLTDSEFCTWNANSGERMPVNCIGPAGAARMCEQERGRLPTEAEWEHAARGRGQRRTYPWGSQPAACCTASLSRIGPPRIPVECAGTGVEPVGSHTGTDCVGGGDVSRDGVLDLGGSLIEYTQDRLRPYSERCGLHQGVSKDPLCPYDGAGAQSCRGSYWNAGLATALTAHRDVASVSSVNGFRCVYEGVRQ